MLIDGKGDASEFPLNVAKSVVLFSSLLKITT